MGGAAATTPASERGRADLAAAYAYCRDLSRRRGRNFYYAFPLMPAAKKNALCAVYAFMRHSDDLVDDTGEAASAAVAAGTAGKDVDAAKEVVRRWREDLAAALDGRYGACPVWPALDDTVQRFSIPRKHFDQLLDGIVMDLTTSRYKTFEDLYRYCYHVASVVGLVCLHVFGFKDKQALHHGEACGIAFQLTNILRDIREDGSIGRVYLPLEDLRRFNVTEDGLLQGKPEAAVADLIRFEAERARDYYAKAIPLFPLIDRDSRAGLRTMVEIYGGILARILRDPLCVYRRRVRVPGIVKVGIALRAFVSPRAPELRF